MRKENFFIGLIAVAAVSFFFGRLSVSTTKRSKSDAPTAANAEKAKSDTDKKDTAGAGDTAAPARVAGSLNVVASPSKGPAVAKVTIVEISDFQ